jgi:hypothetical protein
MKKAFFLGIVSFAVLFGGYVQPAETKKVTGCKETLLSVMTLIIETKDGKQFNATAFLAIKEKIAVTAWQAVRNARYITARFSNGEEFDVSGLIDSDVRKNIAIIKLKIFGRPPLPCNPREPEPGRDVYYWNKEFSLEKTTVNKIEVSKGVKIYYLSSSITPQEVGGPLLNGNGEAVGVLGLIAGKDGESVSIAIPSSYVLALDSTLEVKPWQAIKSTPALTMPDNDAVDVEIAETLIQLHDHFAILNWSCRQTYGMGYRNGVPKFVYENMEELKSQFKKVSFLTTNDSLRARILQQVKQGTADYLKATELYINSIVIAQSSPQGWGAKSQDLFNRADALLSGFPTEEFVNDLNKLKEKSQVFRDILPMEVQYSLGMVKRPSGYTLGITNYARNPFFLLIVDSSSVAQKIGLRAGDTIISLDGHKFTPDENIEDFKVMLKSYQGQRVNAVVKRNGKLQEITLKVPHNL